jgi:hypothetical protein
MLLLLLLVLLHTVADITVVTVLLLRCSVFHNSVNTAAAYISAVSAYPTIAVGIAAPVIGVVIAAIIVPILLASASADTQQLFRTKIFLCTVRFLIMIQPHLFQIYIFLLLVKSLHIHLFY